MAGEDDEAQVDQGGVEERAFESRSSTQRRNGDAEAQKIPDSDSELRSHFAAWQALISVQHPGTIQDFARPGALAK